MGMKEVEVPRRYDHLIVLLSETSIDDVTESLLADYKDFFVDMLWGYVKHSSPTQMCAIWNTLTEPHAKASNYALSVTVLAEDAKTLRLLDTRLKD